MLRFGQRILAWILCAGLSLQPAMVLGRDMLAPPSSVRDEQTLSEFNRAEALLGGRELASFVVEGKIADKRNAHVRPAAVREFGLQDPAAERRWVSDAADRVTNRLDALRRDYPGLRFFEQKFTVRIVKQLDEPLARWDATGNLSLSAALFQEAGSEGVQDALNIAMYAALLRQGLLRSKVFRDLVAEALPGEDREHLTTAIDVYARYAEISTEAMHRESRPDFSSSLLELHLRGKEEGTPPGPRDMSRAVALQEFLAMGSEREIFQALLAHTTGRQVEGDAPLLTQLVEGWEALKTDMEKLGQAQWVLDAVETAISSLHHHFNNSLAIALGAAEDIAEEGSRSDWASFRKSYGTLLRRMHVLVRDYDTLVAMENPYALTPDGQHYALDGSDNEELAKRPALETRLRLQTIGTILGRTRTSATEESWIARRGVDLAERMEAVRGLLSAAPAPGELPESEDWTHAAVNPVVESVGRLSEQGREISVLLRGLGVWYQNLRIGMRVDFQEVEKKGHRLVLQGAGASFRTEPLGPAARRPIVAAPMRPKEKAVARPAEARQSAVPAPGPRIPPRWWRYMLVVPVLGWFAMGMLIAGEPNVPARVADPRLAAWLGSIVGAFAARPTLRWLYSRAMRLWEPVDEYFWQQLPARPGGEEIRLARYPRMLLFAKRQAWRTGRDSSLIAKRMRLPGGLGTFTAEEILAMRMAGISQSFWKTRASYTRLLLGPDAFPPAQTAGMEQAIALGEEGAPPVSEQVLMGIDTPVSDEELILVRYQGVPTDILEDESIADPDARMRLFYMASILEVVRRVDAATAVFTPYAQATERDAPEFVRREAMDHMRGAYALYLQEHVSDAKEEFLRMGVYEEFLEDLAVKTDSLIRTRNRRLDRTLARLKDDTERIVELVRMRSAPEDFRVYDVEDMLLRLGMDESRRGVMLAHLEELARPGGPLTRIYGGKYVWTEYKDALLESGHLYAWRQGKENGLLAKWDRDMFLQRTLADHSHSSVVFGDTSGGEDLLIDIVPTRYLGSLPVAADQLLPFDVADRPRVFVLQGQLPRLNSYGDIALVSFLRRRRGNRWEQEPRFVPYSGLHELRRERVLIGSPGHVPAQQWGLSAPVPQYLVARDRESMLRSGVGVEVFFNSRAVAAGTPAIVTTTTWEKRLRENRAFKAIVQETDSAVPTFQGRVVNVLEESLRDRQLRRGVRAYQVKQMMDLYGQEDPPVGEDKAEEIRQSKGVIRDAYMLAYEIYGAKRSEIGGLLIDEVLHLANIVAYSVDVPVPATTLAAALLMRVPQVEEDPQRLREMQDASGLPPSVWEIVYEYHDLRDLDYRPPRMVEGTYYPDNFANLLIAKARHASSLLLVMGYEYHRLRWMREYRQAEFKNRHEMFKRIFTSLAEKFGLKDFADELKSMSFELLHEEEHAQVLRGVGEALRVDYAELELYAELMREQVALELEGKGIVAKLVFGAKDPASIHEKLQELRKKEEEEAREEGRESKEVRVTDVLDLVRGRVVVQTDKQQSALSSLPLVHALTGGKGPEEPQSVGAKGIQPQATGKPVRVSAQAMGRLLEKKTRERRQVLEAQYLDDRGIDPTRAERVREEMEAKVKPKVYAYRRALRDQIARVQGRLLETLSSVELALQTEEQYRMEMTGNIIHAQYKAMRHEGARFYPTDLTFDKTGDLQARLEKLKRETVVEENAFVRFGWVPEGEEATPENPNYVEYVHRVPHAHEGLARRLGQARLADMLFRDDPDRLQAYLDSPGTIYLDGVPAQSLNQRLGPDAKITVLPHGTPASTIQEEIRNLRQNYRTARARLRALDTLDRQPRVIDVLTRRGLDAFASFMANPAGLALNGRPVTSLAQHVRTGDVLIRAHESVTADAALKKEIEGLRAGNKGPAVVLARLTAGNPQSELIVRLWLNWLKVPKPWSLRVAERMDILSWATRVRDRVYGPHREELYQSAARQIKAWVAELRQGPLAVLPEADVEEVLREAAVLEGFRGSQSLVDLGLALQVGEEERKPELLVDKEILSDRIASALGEKVVQRSGINMRNPRVPPYFLEAAQTQWTMQGGTLQPGQTPTRHFWFEQIGRGVLDVREMESWMTNDGMRALITKGILILNPAQILAAKMLILNRLGSKPPADPEEIRKTIALALAKGELTLAEIREAMPKAPTATVVEGPPPHSASLPVYRAAEKGPKGYELPVPTELAHGVFDSDGRLRVRNDPKDILREKETDEPTGHAQRLNKLAWGFGRYDPAYKELLSGLRLSVVENAHGLVHLHQDRQGRWAMQVDRALLDLDPAIDITPLLALVFNHELHHAEVREEDSRRETDPIFEEMADLVTDHVLYRGMSLRHRGMVVDALGGLAEKGFVVEPYLGFLGPAKLPWEADRRTAFDFEDGAVKGLFAKAFALATHEVVNHRYHQRIGELNRGGFANVSLEDQLENYEYAGIGAFLEEAHAKRRLLHATLDRIKKAFASTQENYDVYVRQLWAEVDPADGKLEGDSEVLRSTLPQLARVGPRVVRPLKDLLHRTDYRIRLRLAIARTMLDASDGIHAAAVEHPFFIRELIGYAKQRRERIRSKAPGPQDVRIVEDILRVLGHAQVESPGLYRDLRAELSAWVFELQEILTQIRGKGLMGHVAPQEIRRFRRIQPLAAEARAMLQMARESLSDNLGSEISEEEWSAKVVPIAKEEASADTPRIEGVGLPEGQRQEKLGDFLTWKSGHPRDVIRSVQGIQESVFLLHRRWLQPRDIHRVEAVFLGEDAHKVTYKLVITDAEGLRYAIVRNVGPAPLPEDDEPGAGRLSLSRQLLHRQLAAAPGVFKRIGGYGEHVLSKGVRHLFWDEEYVDTEVLFDPAEGATRLHTRPRAHEFTRGSVGEHAWFDRTRAAVRAYVGTAFRAWVSLGGGIDSPRKVDFDWDMDMGNMIIGDTVPPRFGNARSLGDKPQTLAGFWLHLRRNIGQLIDQTFEFQDNAVITTADIHDGVLDALGEQDGVEVLRKIKQEIDTKMALGFTLPVDPADTFVYAFVGEKTPKDLEAYLESRDGVRRAIARRAMSDRAGSRINLPYIPPDVMKPLDAAQRERLGGSLEDFVHRYYVENRLYRHTQSPWVWPFLFRRFLLLREGELPRRETEQLSQAFTRLSHRLWQGPFENAEQASRWVRDEELRLGLDSRQGEMLLDATSYERALARRLRARMGGLLDAHGEKRGIYGASQGALVHLVQQMTRQPENAAKLLIRAMDNMKMRRLTEAMGITLGEFFHGLYQEGVIPEEIIVDVLGRLPTRHLAHFMGFGHYPALMRRFLLHDYKHAADAYSRMITGDPHDPARQGDTDRAAELAYFAVAERGMSHQATAYVLDALGDTQAQAAWLNAVVGWKRGEGHFHQDWKSWREKTASEDPSRYKEETLPWAAKILTRYYTLNPSGANALIASFLRGLSGQVELRRSFFDKPELVDAQGRRVEDIFRLLAMLPEEMWYGAFRKLSDKGAARAFLAFHRIGFALEGEAEATAKQLGRKMHQEHTFVVRRSKREEPMVLQTPESAEARARYADGVAELMRLQMTRDQMRPLLAYLRIHDLSMLSTISKAWLAAGKKHEIHPRIFAHMIAEMPHAILREALAALAQEGVDALLEAIERVGQSEVDEARRRVHEVLEGGLEGILADAPAVPRDLLHVERWKNLLWPQEQQTKLDPSPSPGDRRVEIAA